MVFYQTRRKTPVFRHEACQDVGILKCAFEDAVESGGARDFGGLSAGRELNRDRLQRYSLFAAEVKVKKLLWNELSKPIIGVIIVIYL